MSATGASRLARLARGERPTAAPNATVLRPPLDGAEPEQAPPRPDVERCDLCAQPVPPDHRHMLDLEQRRILCACRACALLFDRDAAGGGHYRLIGERHLLLDGFELDDARWDELAIPVDMAFFFRDSRADAIVALYPGPMGATESQLDLSAWDDIERANPILGELEPDSEALLVNRTRGAREHWIVPVDACYRLVAVIKTHWKGLGGGSEVWDRVDAFFDDLRARASAAPRAGADREEAA